MPLEAPVMTAAGMLFLSYMGPDSLDPMSPTEEARRIRTRMQRLADVALRIHSEHTLDRVFQEVADAARDVIGARYAALGVIDESGKELRLFVTSGLSPQQHQEIGSL